MEKRIRELIEADRYLNTAEKAAYPKYQQEQAVRAERRQIAAEFESIVNAYKAHIEELGEPDKLPDRWYLVSCGTSFVTGDKKMYARTGEGDFILPMMREAMEDQPFLAERCEALLTALSGPAAHPFELTDEELNPPKKEYRIQEGDTVYIRTQEQEVVFLGTESVVLADAKYPLFRQEHTAEEFLRLVSENPLNDRYLQTVEAEAEPLFEEPQNDRQGPQPPESRVDEMLRQAELASPLHEKTGQTVFEFEAGNPEPVNIPQEAELAPAEAELAPPPAVRSRSNMALAMLHPKIPAERRLDYRIADDSIGIDTPLNRFYHNIRAIQLLNKLEEENRLANSIEQDVLAQYVGWGGLPEFFEETNPHYTELKDVLSEDEYASARESTLTAFYTPPVVIRSMYQALENLGFRRGNVLEPSCGVGNFLGMKPEALADTKIYGIELDSISGRIARQLYQNSSIAVQGFEKTELPDSFFDVAIGNIPFGDFKLPDKHYDKYNFLIHDYFFARTLDKVRPGGVIAFITSKGTMDKANPHVRKYLAQRADLLGAIRLPNDAFKDAAGTEVTSDILFFQKRDILTAMEPE